MTEETLYLKCKPGDIAPRVLLTGDPARVHRVAEMYLARFLRTRSLFLETWQQDLVANLATGDLAVVDVTAWDPASWPREARGRGLGEAPGGALGHWITIRDRTIGAYQIVDASTWNCSPRDANGRRGALEEALVGTPVADTGQPVEILRTIRSFDPCGACATHAYRPNHPAPRGTSRSLAPGRATP